MGVGIGDSGDTEYKSAVECAGVELLILKGNRPKAEVTAGGAAGDVGTQWGWKLLRVLRRG